MNLSPEQIVIEFGFFPGQTVADFGSGTGHIALALAKILGREGSVVAVDLNADMLVRLKNIAQEENLNIFAVCADIEEPNGTHLVEGAVHGVVISHTLAKLSNKQAVLKEAKRILKNNGSLAIVEEENGMKEKGLRVLAEAEGFKHFLRFQAGDNRYGIVFKKQ